MKQNNPLGITFYMQNQLCEFALKHSPCFLESKARDINYSDFLAVTEHFNTGFLSRCNYLTSLFLIVVVGTCKDVSDFDVNETFRTISKDLLFFYTHGKSPDES